MNSNSSEAKSDNSERVSLLAFKTEAIKICSNVSFYVFQIMGN